MGCPQSSSVEPQLETHTSSNSTRTSQTTFTNNRNRFHALPQTEVHSSNDIRESHQRLTTSSRSPGQPIRTSIGKTHSDELNHLPNNFINVLLLGESGVGKSTFINAIVNYFNFDTLEKARAGKPIALIPVSFLLTVGDHFEERIVTFGEDDLNEDHHHSGQSVTQHCRSYVFPISTQTKIRLIDTPGVGDTRGFDQDDVNMQHILSFINNLTHLNAICVLLKPNESRLNVVFRSYFTRLLGFLGEGVRNNIIFCFTNTRATFFAPGNTGPLLKKMLESHSIEDIPFKKTNTFCFDSESFRYLIALQNGMEFDDYQKEEYQRSWVTSVNESTRLLQYICNNLKSYSQKDWQSIEHAQCRINQLVRPILETIRNIMRNMILLDKTSSN
jgi:GTP-binding protein EngB required for normal cell division